MNVEELISLCKDKGIKKVVVGANQGIEIEFFPPQPKQAELMAMDPVSLSKALTDSMPPDSAMLFASSEDMDVPAEATP